MGLKVARGYRKFQHMMGDDYTLGMFGRQSETSATAMHLLYICLSNIAPRD